MNFTTPPPDEPLLRATWAAIRPAGAPGLAEALRHPTWSRVIDMAAKSAAGYTRPRAAPAPKSSTEPDLFSEAP